MLEVENLNVHIATAAGDLHAVQDVSFSVEKGETLCIVGESGCGKSITALALMGLEPRGARRSAARLRFDGIDMLSLTGRETRALRGNRLSMIFQEPMTALNPLLTIGRQLTDVLHSHRTVSRREGRDRAIHLLEQVGISRAAERLSQYPHELSGGLRQRVVIAMALMCEPDLIIADEPTTALDVTIQAELLWLLSELQRSMGLAMIMITHDLGLVSRIADQVMVMYAGQVVEQASAAMLYSRPSHPYTRALLASVPRPDRPRMQPLPSIAGTVPSLVGQMETCHFLDRCDWASLPCRKPILLEIADPGHPVRCIRHAQLDVERPEVTV